MAKIEIKSELPCDRYADAHPVAALTPAFKDLDDQNHPVARQAAALASNALESVFKHLSLIDENVAKLNEYAIDRTKFIPGQIEAWNTQADKFAKTTTATVGAALGHVLQAETQIEAMQTSLRAQLEAKVTPLPKSDVASTFLAGEIRAHYKSLNDGQRMTLINQAIASGDVQTLGVIFDQRIPRYLIGGMSDESHSAALQHAQVGLAKPEYLQERAVSTALAKLATQRENLGAKLQRAMQISSRVVVPAKAGPAPRAKSV